MILVVVEIRICEAKAPKERDRKAAKLHADQDDEQIPSDSS